MLFLTYLLLLETQQKSAGLLKTGALLVELTGIEPVSEKKTVRVSPGAVCLLTSLDAGEHTRAASG